MPFDRVRLNLFFEQVPDPLVEEVRALLVERRYDRGEVIIEEGSEGEDLYLLTEGRVRIVNRTRTGEEQLLALLHAGDFFGELELVDGRPRSSGVTAVDECVCHLLPRRSFETLLASSHPATMRLMEVLSIRLRTSNKNFAAEVERQSVRFGAEVRKLHQLIEAAKSVNSTLDLDRLLRVILDTALRVVDGERGTVYLLDEDGKQLWSRVMEGTEMKTIRLPLGKGIAGYVAATGDTLNIPDAYLDPRFNPEIDRRSGYRTSTILCMPMRTKEGKISGVFQLLNKRNGTFTPEDEEFIAGLSVHAAVAVENARLHEREKALERMQQEVLLAARIQADLLPQTPPAIPGYDVAGASVAARVVGGDTFDFIPLAGGRWALCLGDASGKGLPASLMMAGVQATVRANARTNGTPAACVATVNELLFQSTGDEKFVTLFYALLDPATHILASTNAGHEYPVLLRSDGTMLRLSEGGTVLGMLEGFPFTEESTPMYPGDLLVVFSDGVTESMDASGTQFGEVRVCEVVRRNAGRPASEIVAAVLQAAAAHAGGMQQSDDMTVIALRRTA